VSVTEPSDALNAGMVIRTEGRRLALSRKSPSSINTLAWLDLARLFLLFTRPVKMEQAEYSETSAHKIQTAGKYLQERI